MAQPPALLGPDGAPVPAGLADAVRKGALSRPARSGMRASWGDAGGKGYFPYEASNWTSQEMGDWLPWIRSPDSEINLFRDRMVARARDMVRNDGWAAGSIGRILDSTIGNSYRFISNPDWRWLKRFDPAFDEQWAEEFAEAWEATWRGYSEDLRRYNDVGRKLTVAQQFRLGLRHKLVDGDDVTVTHWLPDRVGYGAADFATAFQVVDPDRLCNPYQMVDTRELRGGVHIQPNTGEPLGYWFRRAEPNDWYNSAESMEWEYVAREDEDGFLRVIHDFDHDRAGQNRGVSIFAPILSRLKMLARYYGVELQAATIASVFGLYITSPFDPEMVEQALQGPSANPDGYLGAYQDLRDNFHKKNAPMFNGVRVPMLAPGEGVHAVSAARPNEQFSPFTHEMLRSVAAVTGQSAEQVTQDYSETNYSSARAAIVEAEKTFNRRMWEFNLNTATPVASCVMHEAMERNLLPMPLKAWKAPSFLEGRTAFVRGRWLGVAAGWVDPVAERQGEILGLDAGFGTLEESCARQGADWRDNLRQRARESREMERLGLPRPQWMGEKVTATEDSKKPKAA
jgi:lambda family phage portal protein